MLHRLLVLLLLTLGLSGCTSTVRVMSYNIHHGEGTDDVFDLPRLAAVITAEDPDFVALQEVDRATGRSSGVDQAAELGALTGMHVAYGPAMDYDGGEYGVAILSRHPIDAVVNHALPHRDGYEPRTLLLVTVNVPRVGAVVFGSTHFQHNNADDRLDQARAVVRHATDMGPDASIIIAGDLNAERADPPIRTLLAAFDDLGADSGLTWPSDTPEVRIDYVLARPMWRFRVLDARTVHEPIASDHLPVVVDLVRR